MPPYDAAQEFPRLVEVPPEPVRGVIWLVRHVAMGAVALGAAVMLIQLGCLLAAERALAFVAQDAVRFAQLPRVTSGAVHRQIDAHLAQLGWNDVESQVTLTADGIPVAGSAIPRPGQRLQATISVPSEVILPTALAVMSHYIGLKEVVVHRAAVVR